jgi:hypothetical protein
VVALTFEGSLHRGPFDQDDNRKLKRLIPHVQRALNIRDRLEAHEVHGSTLSSVVERSHIGVIVLDQKGPILEATGLAKQLMKSELGIRCASDHTLWGGRVLFVQKVAISLLRCASDRPKLLIRRAAQRSARLESGTCRGS